MARRYLFYRIDDPLRRADPRRRCFVNGPACRWNLMEVESPDDRSWPPTGGRQCARK